MCSYCGCRAIPTIARLFDEHTDIINAMGTVRRAVAADDDVATASAARALGSKLHRHTAVEERGLLAELRQDPEFTVHVDTLCAEHRTIDDLLTQVSQGHFTAAEALEKLLRRQHPQGGERGIPGRRHRSGRRRLGQSRRARIMSAYVPPQHGAWAFLALPLVLGAIVTPWTPLLLVLAVAWVAAYPLYAALGLVRAKRPQRFLKPFLVWSAVVLPAVVVLLVWRPWLLWVGLGYAALFAVNLAYARRTTNDDDDVVLRCRVLGDACSSCGGRCR